MIIEDFEVAIINKFLQKSWLNNQERTWFYNTKDHAFKTQKSSRVESTITQI